MKNKKADKELEGFMPENKKAEWECTTNPMPPNTKKCERRVCQYCQVYGINYSCHTPPPEKEKCGHEGNYSACLCGTYDALLEGVVDTPSPDKSEHDGTCRTPECYEKRPTPAVEDWEKEFDEMWTHVDSEFFPEKPISSKYDKGDIKEFIRSLLASREKEYESILKIKNKKWREWLQLAREADRKRIVEGLKGMMSSDDKWSKRHQEQVLWTDIGYNQAIADAIHFITNLK